ncbi:MAG: atp4 subunit B of the stator stalk of mitochondrial F1F0 ATP synthase [Chaenotheca gracillima]|nr:MAG: atp4 subunit B of the stator stalk of mitochondrial F1F0 ATP synthase [Chaenotheca gracillima]
MPLRDLLKKRDKIKDGAGKSQGPPLPPPPPPPAEFTFMRSDTTTQEILEPPSFDDYEDLSTAPAPVPAPSSTPKRHSRFRGFSTTSKDSGGESSEKPANEKRLSQRLHLRSTSRSTSTSSVHVPEDLPSIDDATGYGEGDDNEAKWEQRATLLARGNSDYRPATSPPTNEKGRMDEESVTERMSNLDTGGAGKRNRSRSVSDPKGDENIQEAIRLHEAGEEYDVSTAMFGRLADPSGANNALSQVLYGLALRHGWGITPDASRAVHYLSLAASNSADIESLALRAGMKKGGAAKGELVLAIFELANCYRHGWGVTKDALAARTYYETAANLGDTDAMNEAAWCYLNGFGGKKDKGAAAKYYRRAETSGNKTLGNSWIWKEKYN